MMLTRAAELNGRVVCNDTATTEIYTLSLHDALPISEPAPRFQYGFTAARKYPRIGTAPPSAAASASVTSARTTRPAVRSEEHTSELQSRQYLVCRLLLEKKNTQFKSSHTPISLKLSH